MLSASVLKRVILYNSLAINNSPDSSHANYVKWEDACSINSWEEVETTTMSNSKHSKKLKGNSNNITVTVSQEKLYMQHT